MTDIEVPAAPVAPGRTPLGVARGVLKTMRPRQWVKNVLVFAAPFVGGDLLTPGIIPDLLMAFLAFSLAASGIYLVNDAKDVDADRAHPTKRFRPIAAGVVAPRLAIAVAVVLLSRRWRSACSRRCSWWWCWRSTSSSSWRTASGSSTRPCSTSASSPRGSCCARSRVARPPGSCCRSGSCWWRASGRCSWSRASGTPR